MTQITGHRGGRNLWPENSLEGFRKVLAVGVEGVELDIHLSDAGELLVIHDATLDRTTEGTGPVRRLSPEARLATRLKESDECVPVLSDVLEIFKDVDLELHLEIKMDETGQPYAGLPARVLAEIDRFGLRGRSCLTSFNLDVLEECRELAPEVDRLCSINANSAADLGVVETVSAAAERARYVAVHKDLLAERWDDITGLVPLDRIGAWVTNTPEEIRRWLSAGPAFITSDDPVLAVNVRREMREATAGTGTDPVARG